MNTIQEIIAVSKRRGFIYPGSEIYGGLANTYDYGPIGTELLRNIQNLWWKYFVHQRNDVYGLYTNILMSPKIWEASGHTKSFTDAVVDCKKCKNRMRVDHLIEQFFIEKGKEVKVEGKTLDELNKIITKEKIPCPTCSSFQWTKPRNFNLLFETHIGIVPEKSSLAYLRGEIAQGMFVNFKNVLDSLSIKLPFGLAQSGAAFRNEVTLGKFIFRTLQFNLSEIEYFFDAEKSNWKNIYNDWKRAMESWVYQILRVKKSHIRWRTHTDDERSFYSKHTEDIEYAFPFGYKELYGLAYRTDYDLKNHMKKSGVDLRYQDYETKKKFIPHVVEPTFGMDRTFLVLLFEHYNKETKGKSKRIVLSLPAFLAPYKAAIFPLVRNKKEIVEKSKKIYKMLLKKYPCMFDDRGNIGKRYFSQDEIGTPFCITVDYQTLDDDTVTIRDRDTTKQERVSIEKILPFIETKMTYL